MYQLFRLGFLSALLISASLVPVHAEQLKLIEHGLN